MTPNQSLSELSSKILVSLDDVLNKEKPDYVFVHGDTTTTAFASIAAFYNKIKLCHIEAGLRTFDKFFAFSRRDKSNYYGEINRFTLCTNRTSHAKPH